MTTIKQYIKEWQVALQHEIAYVKKYGSTKYHVSNGHLLSSDQSYSYYFETATSLRIPVGSTIRLEWEEWKQTGRVLSSEGKSIIISFEKSFGDLVSNAILFHDPWELLEQLIQRLDDAKKSKKKRNRMLQVITPSLLAKHPTNHIKSNIHELVLRSKYNPVTYLWGPPGTGKTYTLARVAANKYFKEKRVLVLSHSNQAVDVLMGEINHFVQKMDKQVEGEILRYGMSGASVTNDFLTTMQLVEKREPGLFDKRLQFSELKRGLKNDLSQSFSHRDTDQLLEIEEKLARVLERIRRKEIEFVKEAKIIGTTLAKAAGDAAIFEQEFDIVIIDEASMAYVPQIAFASSLAKRVIVCGDFKQLPPIASARDSIVNEWLKEDIFHKANVVKGIDTAEFHPHLFLLKKQRRMHPEISGFTNQHIYQSLVGDHEKVGEQRRSIALKKPFSKRASVLLDTSFTGEFCINEQASHSRMNPLHLFLSFQLIHEAYMDGMTSIGYVTPFRAQAVLMEHLLADLYEKECGEADIISATVHRFQGSEREMIIFDTVDGYPQNRASMLLAGRESERLINVAMTRAKGKFINVTDKEFIRKQIYPNKTIRQLVDYQEKHKQSVSPGEIGQWIKHQHPRLRWIHARKLEPVFEDIQHASRSIVISLPDHTVLSKQWVEILNNRSNKIKLTIIATKDIKPINKYKKIDHSLPFPFVSIDEQIIWLALPLEGMKRLKPPYITARLDAPSFSEYFLKQLPIHSE